MCVCFSWFQCYITFPYLEKSWNIQKRSFVLDAHFLWHLAGLVCDRLPLSSLSEGGWARVCVNMCWTNASGPSNWNWHLCRPEMICISKKESFLELNMTLTRVWQRKQKKPPVYSKGNLIYYCRFHKTTWLLWPLSWWLEVVQSLVEGYWNGEKP